MIRHSVCRWCFDSLPLEQLAQAASTLGLVGIDLVNPEDWPTLTAHNLVGTMTPTHSLQKGLNNPKNHPECLAKIKNAIDATLANPSASLGNIITFSGDRESLTSGYSEGLDDDTGLLHTVDAIKQIIALFEHHKLTLHLELLNSKVDHPGYMCDRSDWAAAVVNRVGSPNLKILYDIYHMQVQEGDLIATIQKLAPMIGHYHTAGCPGRHELGGPLQEIHYPNVIRAIKATGFKGIVAHEFVPTNKENPLASLKEAIQICS